MPWNECHVIFIYRDEFLVLCYHILLLAGRFSHFSNLCINHLFGRSTHWHNYVRLEHHMIGQPIFPHSTIVIARERNIFAWTICILCLALEFHVNLFSVFTDLMLFGILSYYFITFQIIVEIFVSALGLHPFYFLYILSICFPACMSIN